MESETEEVDLVISRFIPLFECNLYERLDGYKLSKQTSKDHIRNFISTLDGNENEDQINLLENSSENIPATLNESSKVDLNWLSPSVISNSDSFCKPLDVKPMCIEKNKLKCDKNIFIEKSKEFCFYAYNLPILFDPEIENNNKHIKLFEKYGGRDNIYIESVRVMESAVLEECNENEQITELETERFNKSNEDLNKRENNNNITSCKNYLNDKYNEQYNLKSKTKIISNEILPWTIKLRTRKNNRHSEFNVNNKLYNSSSEELLEFDNDDEEEWTPGGSECEKQATDSDSSIQHISHSAVANKTSNIGGKTQSRPSSRCGKSRQNSRPSSTTKETIHYCHYPGCHMYFNRPSRLLIHGRTHTGERPFVCSVKGCERTYTRQTHLQRHMIRNHKPKDTNHKPKDINQSKRCDKCDKNFADAYSLQKHKTQYHERREYSCDVCNKVFKKHQHLKSHSYLHTGIQPYECQHPGCSMRFINPSKLKRHSRIHESGRYECSYETNGVVCGEKFDRHHDLRLHMSYNHPKECDVCGRQFKQKRSLRIHRSTHENVREAFFCPIPECDKFYYHNRNLTAHIRMSHEKSYIFECGVCNAILATKQKLSDHMKTHEAGYKRDWSRSKPTKPRKDKGVSKTDLTKLLSGFDEKEVGTSDPELEDMEIEEQREIEDQEISSKNLYTNIEDSYSNCSKVKSRSLEHFGGLEYMDVDDKIQTVGTSENIDCLGIQPQYLKGSSYGIINNDEYYPNSSQFNLLLANDDKDSDKSYQKDSITNDYESNKLNQGKILKLVQGKTSSVSIKTKLG